MANKFKIGDEVVCTVENMYYYTDIGNICRVIDLSIDDYIWVEVVSGPNKPKSGTNRFKVYADNFELTKIKSTPENWENGELGQDEQHVKKSEVLDMRGKRLVLRQEVAISDLSDLHVGQIVDIDDISKDVIVKYRYTHEQWDCHEVQTGVACVKSDKLVGLSDGD